MQANMGQLNTVKLYYPDQQTIKQQVMEKLFLPSDVSHLLNLSKSIICPTSREELISLSLGGAQNKSYNVEYEVGDSEPKLEATVVRCKNGIAVNYTEDYMRRRDPDCLVVGDDFETDKAKYSDVYGEPFKPLRHATLDWLKGQDLIVMPFMAGGSEFGYESLLIAPLNAAFFAGALADLQGFLPLDAVPDCFKPRAIIYLAPTFRHTHFSGKQIVVHNRLKDLHEVFSYNLYPGPSAKKGIYGVLLNIGEQASWVTAHASTVKVVTPYDNEIVIMHEGASGGGKSEMIENIHKEPDGRILLGQNLITDEKIYMELSDSCTLRPVTDDMALCHPAMQNDSRKLVVKDAEQGWFLRLDHIKQYGTSPQYEKILTQPQEPLVFLNIQGVEGATCLVWEHTLDSDGKPCPNPRVILPRRLVPDIVEETVEVDVRSFGVRTPMSTRDYPSYGILGLLHILPPSLAWLWRLVAPRGFNNPSIIDSAGMTSEGVGSYWPFATGKRIKQANLLLDQVIRASGTRYVLIPNQHIGAYKVGFMPQWIAREYIARRGSAKFKPEHLVEAPCQILGFCLDSMKLDGQFVRKHFLQPEMQAHLGIDGYLAGAKMLTDFFKSEAEQYNTEELHPLGRQIIDYLLKDAPLSQYVDLIPMRF